MKRIFHYLKPYAFLAIISPLLMIGEVTADLCLPQLMSIIVDHGIEGVPLKGDSFLGRFSLWLLGSLFGDSYGSMHIIVTFGVLMLLIVLVGGFFGVMCAYTASKASQSLGHDLRTDAYRQVMSLSIEQTDKFTTGSLVTRMTNDISMIIDFVEMFLRMLVRAPMFFVGGLIMLIVQDVSFGVIMIIALPVMALTLALVLGKAVPIYGTVQKKLDRVNAVVQENVTGARVIKAYVREEHETERFRVANDDLRHTNVRVLSLMAIMHPVLMIVMNAAIIAILYIGGNKISIGDSDMSTGAIMKAITYVTQVLMSIMMITNLSQSISRAMASVKRVNEVMDTEPVICSGSVTEGSGDIAVSMRNVSFRYPEASGSPVLHGINIDIKKGETFAIIGATGSGKTSLIALIPRFYDATEGEVLVDGVNVKDYDLGALRRKISYVMQKSELFSGTIEENIRVGKPDATREEIEAAAECAQAQEFVNSFNEGYGSYIAEKGASLSGGQKQRMSVARALVRRPEIIILDDSTSALDLATEARLRTALREKLSDTTVIMIAQRIASVRDADRIAVIEHGTIKDCGNHEYLMANSETYRDIYNSQMKNGGEL